MTILATAMGCAFLIVLASVGFGIHKSIIEEITQGRLTTEIDIHGKVNGSTSYMTDEDVAFFEGIDGVKAVTTHKRVENETTYSIGDYTGFGETMVVDYEAEKASNFELEEGRLPEAANEVVVGYNFPGNLRDPDQEISEEDQQLTMEEIEKKYGYPESLLGKTLTLTVPQTIDGERQEGTFEVTVVGVAKKPTREWMMDMRVLISEEKLNEIEEFTGTALGRFIDPMMSEEEIEQLKQTTESHYNEVNVYADSAGAVKSISEEIKEAGYYTYSIADELDQVDLFFAVVKIGLILVGTIAVIIASIGIYNTMSMAVTERTQDIGIMKAIGGHPKMIKQIFLIESTYIGLMGALFGVITSYIISIAVNKLLPMVITNVLEIGAGETITFSYIPTSLTVICVAISLLVAMISGLKPAVKATKIDVIKALRRDI